MICQCKVVFGFAAVPFKKKKRGKNQLTCKHQLHASYLNGSAFLSYMRPWVLQLPGICVASSKNTELAFQNSNNNNRRQPINTRKQPCLLKLPSEGWEKGVETEQERQGKRMLQPASYIARNTPPSCPPCCQRRLLSAS